MNATERQMSDAIYEGDCVYCWGDPRLRKKFLPGRAFLRPDGIKFEGSDDSLFWPRASIEAARYEPTYAVDMDSVGSPEAAEDLAVALAMDRIPDPAMSLIVRDPEGVYQDGFDIRLLFDDEYPARVFAKRVADAFGLAGSGDQQNH